MFDFFRSRDKAVRTMLTVLLGFVALSMVAYLIPGGPGSPNMSGGADGVLAEIGDEKVTTREVAAKLQEALRGKQIPPEILQNYVPELINQMIAERAVAFQASRMGYLVSDQEVSDTIHSLLPRIFEGGFNKELYAAFLAQQNLTIPEFEANVRKQMMLNKLAATVMEGVIVTPDEIEGEFRRRNERAAIQYVAFSADKLRSQVQLSPADIQGYFNANRANFKVPEKRSFDVLIANEDKIGATVTITDEDLKKAYNANLDRFRTGERVRARHILLMTTGKSADEVKKLEAKINDLLKQIKGGADFAELARKNSDDSASAARGGDLDWIQKGQMVPNFEAAAFGLKKGEVSGVVQTQYGYHIVKADDREEARLKPFEEAKAELATEARQRMVFERMQSAADQGRAALVKNPGNAAAIAAQFNLAHYVVTDAQQSDPIQEIGVNAEFGNSVFALQKGGVTPVITAPGNKLVFATVTGITAARNAELSEVENQVRDQLTSIKARELLEGKRAEAARAITEFNGDLAKIAKSMGGEVHSTPEFGRDGAAEGLGSATYFADAFVKPVGTVLGPLFVSEQVVIAKVTSKTEADLSKLAAERDQMVLAIKSRKARERKDLFEEGLVSKLIDEGKVKVNQEAIKRLQSSYRS